MAGEWTIKDWSADNKANSNFVGYVACDIDVPNSDAITTSVTLPAVAGECIGVVYDASKLKPDGTVYPNSAVTVKSIGFARVTANAAITVGAYVNIATVGGFIAAKAQAGAGAQPGAIVGRALQAAAALNDRPLIFLMIGCRY